METLGFELRDEATLSTLTMDVLKFSEIEVEILPVDQVRSSVARQLGSLVYSDRNVDGVVEMMLDATQQYQKPLSAARLFVWYASLFPTGRSDMHAIEVGQWRTLSDASL